MSQACDFLSITFANSDKQGFKSATCDSRHITPCHVCDAISIK